ncbi:hypothetical protein ACFE04_003345 [Oxalis oulophora]
MDAMLGRMDGRFKAFMKDSTMMRIVNYAMDKAHEKVKSKEGAIARLNEISKFYQLAVMQLEVCMKFVQDESDSYTIPENNPGDVLAGLREVRDRLQRRLQESEHAISDKDRELTERLSNEVKLRQALEQRERELVSLRANIERSKSEELLLNREGDGFCELKNSVDKQVLNIKHKLVEEDHDEKIENVEITKIEHMGSDIDILKQTMDLAFNKMQNTICISGSGPLEQQWRSNLEQDITAILIKTFIEDFQENFDDKMNRQEKEITKNLSHQFQDLMKESTELRNELELLINQNESQLKNSKSEEDSRIEGESDKASNPIIKAEEHVDNFVAKLIKNHESIIRRKSAERNPQIVPGKGSPKKTENELVNSKRIQDVIAKLDSFTNWKTKLGKLGVVRTSSEKNDEQRSGIDSFEAVWDRLNKKPKIANESNEKLLCNEIRILKQKQEDSNLEIVIMEDIHCAVFRSTMTEFQNKLDNLRLAQTSATDCQDSASDFLQDSTNDELEESLKDKLYIFMFQEMYREWNEGFTNENLLHEEIRMLKQKREDSNFQIGIMEDIYCTAFRSSMNEVQEIYRNLQETRFPRNFKDYESLENEESFKKSSSDFQQDSTSTASSIDGLEGILNDKICIILFQEMYREWNDELASCGADNDIKEEISRIVFVESIRDVLNAADQDQALIALQEVESPRNFKNYKSLETEGNFKKPINDCLQDCLSDNDVMEEIFRIVFVEAISDILNSADQELIKLQKVEIPRNFNESTKNEEYSLQVDIYLVFIGKMFEEWAEELNSYKFASLMREEIYQSVISEALKESLTKLSESEIWNQGKLSKDSLPPRSRHRRRVSSGVEYMVQTIETLIKCFEAGEDLMIKASSEIQEHHMQLDLVGLELEEFDECQIFQELLTSEKNTSISVYSKLEKALHHLVSSREVLSELGSSLGITVRGAVYDRMTSVSVSVDEKEPFQETEQEIDNDETKSLVSDISACPIPDFAQLLVEFEWLAQEKLQTNIFRLERFKSDLDPVIEQVAMLRQKDSLYHKAFITRCQNLRKAEIEVDMLGDQVDTLLGLLEKIYITLNYHSPVLQQYFEVSDFLKLIKKELNGEVHANSKY